MVLGGLQSSFALIILVNPHSKPTWEVLLPTLSILWNWSSEKINSLTNVYIICKWYNWPVNLGLSDTKATVLATIPLNNIGCTTGSPFLPWCPHSSLENSPHGTYFWDVFYTVEVKPKRKCPRQGILNRHWPGSSAITKIEWSWPIHVIDHFSIGKTEIIIPLPTLFLPKSPPPLLH